MALVDQKGIEPVSIYMKHPVSGVKIVDAIELADCAAAGYVKLQVPTCMYHALSGSDVFDACEVPELEKAGWVDTPAKLIPEVVSATAVPVIDLSDEDTIRIDKVAQELLAGEGLNRSSLMRALDMNPSKTTQRNRFQPVYAAIFANHLPNIKKQGMDFFWKSKPKVSDETSSEKDKD